MRPVAFLLLGLRVAFAGTHSLQYVCTAVSGAVDFPEFTAVGLVDDQQFMYFDSNTKTAVPKTEWIRQNEGEDYWSTETQTHIGRYHDHKNHLHSIMNLFSQSEGVHTLQVMFGCELEDDLNTAGHWQYGYDGEDFLIFDKNSRTWIAANPQAVITKNKWEADRGDLQYRKSYLENICIEWLKKYVNYSRNVLERKDAPKVSLLQKSSSSPVECHATGFYPRNIMMSWKKNNEDVYEDVEISSTLPNEDGSFQRSISLSVEPEEWKKNPDVYRCVIQHVGEETEIVASLGKSIIRSNELQGTDNVSKLTDEPMLRN